MALIDDIFDVIGRRLAARIGADDSGPSVADAYLDMYAQVLRPGDVLLVDGGGSKVAAAIKYLTQSTWSHAALYVGGMLGPDHGPHSLVEAELGYGVIASPLSKYRGRPLRVARPVGLATEDVGQLVAYARGALGKKYDLRNVVDLMRWLWPTPPVPASQRRRMIALGSGEPTRAICSTLIAQAFESIGYPILLDVERLDGADGAMTREVAHIRHHSLYTPRDFDVSPYFAVVKPTLELGFDHRCVPYAGRTPPTHCGKCGREVLFLTQA
jgi:hypothetical protein